MAVLIACEESQAVTKAMRAVGVETFSCDVKPASGSRPEWHIQADVLTILKSRAWRGVIAFPPCTDLCVSGARWFAAKRADGRQQASIDFFMRFVGCAEFVAIENPVGIMSTQYRKPDQIIQPWQFGHAESKKTCLWLRGLPKLESTVVLETPKCGFWENQTASGQNKLGPSAERAAIRSKTYAGIADAMANQWKELR